MGPADPHQGAAQEAARFLTEPGSLQNTWEGCCKRGGGDEGGPQAGEPRRPCRRPVSVHLEAVCAATRSGRVPEGSVHIAGSPRASDTCVVDGGVPGLSSHGSRCI